MSPNWPKNKTLLQPPERLYRKQQNNKSRSCIFKNLPLSQKEMNSSAILEVLCKYKQISCFLHKKFSLHKDFSADQKEACNRKRWLEIKFSANPFVALKKLLVAMKKLVVLTTEYVVQDNDTVEKIAARFDCTPSQLIKLNKLTSRMLFTGQNILVPDGTTVEEIVEDSSVVQQPSLRKLSRIGQTKIQKLGMQKNLDSLTSKDFYHCPLCQSSEELFVLVNHKISKFKLITIKQAFLESDSHDGRRRSSNPLTQADDAECIRKFFKVHTNYLLGNSSGKATGVFIVTPNCAMFDPDVEPDEQFDEVQEKYGVVAPIDDVISISLYEMKLEKPAKRKV
uniref:LysM domain-containing protein n=1 Tax=Romanomermis culicivorax TaxID=13658 RepID=A0A915K2I7_ROMCU